MSVGGDTGKPVAGFFAELRRRRILHVGGAYIAGAWLGAEVLDFLLGQFGAPDWTYRLLAIAFVVGFPVAMILAWVIQVQEDGTWALDPARGDYRMIAAATLLGAAVTALLSWWIIWANPPGPVYRPMPNSIAVLPIDDGGDLYTGFVVALEQADDPILVRLGSVDKPGDLQEFGQGHELERLILGRVVDSSDQMRIEVQVFDVEEGEVTWSQSFDTRGMSSQAAIVQVTNSVLAHLGMTPLEPWDVARTDSGEAYHQFIAAEQNALRQDPDSLAEAIAAFERAIELDPGYAQAYFRLADSLYERALLPGVADERREEFQVRAREAAERGYVLDPNSGTAMSLVGMAEPIHQLRIQAFERALELDPDHDRSYFRLARELKESGNLEDAEILIARAIRLRPGSVRYELERADILERQGLPASEAH